MIRLLGMIALALAAAAGGYDALLLLSGRAEAGAKIGDWWSHLHQSSLLLLQPAIERHVEPYVGQWLWDPVMLTILTSPAWLVLGLIGALLLLFGRKRSPAVRHLER